MASEIFESLNLIAKSKNLGPEVVVSTLQQSLINAAKKYLNISKNIEAEIIDRGWDEGWVLPETPKARTGKRVAVIGTDERALHHLFAEASRLALQMMERVGLRERARSG